jgi:hypothetical protein
MTWTVHPAKENTTKTVISLVFISALLIYVFIFWGLVWGALGLVFLFVTLQSYYFPTRYELTDEQVLVKGFFVSQKRKLVEFKKIYVGKNGVLLSPFKHKTFLNNFRGIFLFLPRERDQIVVFLKERIGEPTIAEPVSPAPDPQ